MTPRRELSLPDIPTPGDTVTAGYPTRGGYRDNTAATLPTAGHIRHTAATTRHAPPPNGSKCAGAATGRERPLYVRLWDTSGAGVLPARTHDIQSAATAPPPTPAPPRHHARRTTPPCTNGDGLLPTPTTKPRLRRDLQREGWSRWRGSCSATPPTQTTARRRRLRHIVRTPPPEEPQPDADTSASRGTITQRTLRAVWRRRRDLNPRDRKPAYPLSRRGH